MTFQVISPDAARRVDPPVSRFLQTLPQGRDIAVVPITRLDGFQFRDELRGTLEGKPWVLLDFSEFGPEWDQQTSHLWGRDRLAHGWFGGDEWAKLDAFIREHPPLITFQRELLLKDVSDTMQPVEYLNYSAPIQAETEDQFNARPIDVFFQWGLSNPYRPHLHGEIFKHSQRLGYDVCSQLDHLDRCIARKDRPSIWAVIHTPHYARVSNDETIRWFGKSKVVIAAPGCGAKTFRHGEINNSIIAMRSDKLAYSVNQCGIALGDAPVDALWGAVRGRDADYLYRTYLLNHAAADSLRPARYVPEYIIPEIQKRI